MDKTGALRLLQALIEYFEAGNKTSDTIAKDILDSDGENLDFWQKEIQQLKNGADWTGLRAPEADILVLALRQINKMIDKS